MVYMSLNEISMFCQIEYFIERIRAARNIFVDAAAQPTFIM